MEEINMKYFHSWSDGHGENGSVNIIEFEATGNPNSAYTGNERDLTGWAGKTVTKIINRGTYLR